MELILLLLGLLIGYIFILFYEFSFYLIQKKIKRKLILRFKELHLHHSLYGVLFLIIFIATYNFLFLGIGIGIIVRHTQAEKRFVFIDRS